MNKFDKLYNLIMEENESLHWKDQKAAFKKALRSFKPYGLKFDWWYNKNFIFENQGYICGYSWSSEFDSIEINLLMGGEIYICISFDINKKQKNWKKRRLGSFDECEYFKFGEWDKIKDYVTNMIIQHYKPGKIK